MYSVSSPPSHTHTHTHTKNNKFVVPSSLRVSNNQPISQTNKNLVVELTDIMGGSVGSFDVRVNSITDPDGTEMKRGKPMSAGDDK